MNDNQYNNLQELTGNEVERANIQHFDEVLEYLDNRSGSKKQ